MDPGGKNSSSSIDFNVIISFRYSNIDNNLMLHYYSKSNSDAVTNLMGSNINWV